MTLEEFVEILATKAKLPKDTIMSMRLDEIQHMTMKLFGKQITINLI